MPRFGTIPAFGRLSNIAAAVRNDGNVCDFGVALLLLLLIILTVIINNKKDVGWDQTA